MGKTTIYTCDICGKEYRDRTHLTSLRLPALRDDGYGNESVRAHDVDACEQCRNRYEELLINHFAELHIDSYGTITRPVMCKAAPEEQHTQDIEELEEELERLRDVKDDLFETNFKLTAILRANGIEVDG